VKENNVHPFDPGLPYVIAYKQSHCWTDWHRNGSAPDLATAVRWARALLEADYIVTAAVFTLEAWDYGRAKGEPDWKVEKRIDWHSGAKAEQLARESLRRSPGPGKIHRLYCNRWSHKRSTDEPSSPNYPERPGRPLYPGGGR